MNHHFVFDSPRIFVPYKQAVWRDLCFLSDEEILRRIKKPSLCLYSSKPQQLKQRICVLEHFKVKLGKHIIFGEYPVLPRSAHVLAAIEQAQAKHQEALEMLELAAKAQQNANVAELRRATKAKCNKRLRARARQLAA